jgi:hypothetical protein
MEQSWFCRRLTGLQIFLSSRPSVKTLGYSQEKKVLNTHPKRLSVFPMTAAPGKKSDALEGRHYL